MTLLGYDGHDDELHALKWISTLAVAPSYAETPRYGMGKCFKAGSSSGRLALPLPASAQVIAGIAFKVDNVSSTHVIASLYGDTGATQHHLLQVSTTGQLQACRGGTVLASSTAGLIVPGNWNYVEARTTIADSGGVFEVKLNGTTVITYSGDTKNGGTATNFDLFAYGGATNIDAAVTYDDFYIVNTLGTVNNTFLGEQVVQLLQVNGAGSSTGFTPIGSANNWENVDEVPIDTADYNAASVVGTKDTYSLANLVGSTGAIAAVRANLVASKTGVGAANLKAVVRSGGTDYTDATVALGASPQWYGAIRETDPATGAAWTSTNVNALQVGAEVA